MLRKLSLLALVGLLAAASGCARRTPVAELDAGGADIGVAVVLKSGEALRGRLLSMTEERMLLDARYPIRGEVRLAGAGERRRVESNGAVVPGDLVAIERDGTERTAVVRRAVEVTDVLSATFHRSGSEASLGPLLSTLVGPLVGALLGLAI